MPLVERTGSDFTIDAKLLVEAFDLTEGEVRERMRAGKLTSKCESGVDDDSGFWRLTFYHNDRACRFVVNEDGMIVKRTVFPTKPRSSGGG